MGSLKEGKCWSIEECIKASCNMLDYKVYNVDNHKHLLCPSTKLEGAHEMFSNNIMHINNVLIGGYVQENQGEGALRLFEEMKIEGVLSNSITLSSCLKACGGVENTAKGRDIHAEISTKGLVETDAFLGSVDKMSYKGSKSLMEVDWSFLGILLKVGIFFKILTIIFNMERRLCPLYET